MRIDQQNRQFALIWFILEYIWVDVEGTFQTNSFSSGLFRRHITPPHPRPHPRTSTALRGHIVGQILALKPRNVPGIPVPKGAGHTNDWRIIYICLFHVYCLIFFYHKLCGGHTHFHN